MADVIDEERYQLLRELVRPVVVGAVGHDGRHAVGIVECANKVVARCLTCRIGAVWIVLCSFHEEVLTICLMLSLRRCFGREWCRNAFWMSHFECAIDFISGDVVEALALVLLRE